jgi:hypothetical protein
MAHWLPESLLEMHFHSALIAYYAKKFKGKFIRLYKPVPQKEAWVGFDQAWTSSDLSESELFNNLKAAIGSSTSSIKKFYLGEFLQFKVIETISRKSTRTPVGFSTPYLRSELSLTPNKHTGISQHETLLKLMMIKHAAVFYTCGMVFSEAELWQQPVDLKKLKFVDIKTAPSGWATNESHSVCFQNETAKPVWCSDPIPGNAFSISELSELERLPTALDGLAALTLIQDAANAIRNSDNIERLFPERIQAARYLPTCFALLEFEQT